MMEAMEDWRGRVASRNGPSTAARSRGAPAVRVEGRVVVGAVWAASECFFGLTFWFGGVDDAGTLLCRGCSRYPWVDVSPT